MNKGELIDAMASDTGLTKADAEKALNSFTDNVGGALANGSSVTLIGFGTFSKQHREARQGRNPQTGETIQIAAKNVAKFKAGSKLDERLN